MSENHFFAEKELCNSRLNDRIVEKRRKHSEPAHWAASTIIHQSSVVMRSGVVARVHTEHATDSEPQVAGGGEWLEGLSISERRALLAASAVQPRQQGSSSVVNKETVSPRAWRSFESRSYSSYRAKRKRKAAVTELATSALSSDQPAQMRLHKRRVTAERLSFRLDEE
mmetsp:Transcript_17702/g.29533  ORF Transcript_17702/g.29533 Transcript_17702/m.29533 type:complete len:169 (+) Transcript_17702:93-599(+)|eukprot:CAMPEP_0119316652 /NCGR_PEP_ID=MMETSP1333-20130426/40319_1 /TAXON_ID=418940 /ORGANISM="Scyphosphaera apsteinii, Strain RCC1455" /LENGTH=168 /DNA_ID=CAMNT_0007322353 /DNA_START=78 /DNA_END=584 /DNA_ORIENTATION=-